MEKRINLLVVVIILGISLLEAAAQTTLNGGRGLLRVFSAEPLGGSQLYANSYFQSYLTNDHRQAASLTKDYTFSFGLTYPLGNHTELTARLVAYQSDQQHIWGPPGDTQLGIKYQTPLSTNNVLTGVRAFLIFPTARLHNVPFEPYSSGKLALGLQALLTIDMTESFPLAPLKLHANVGYVDHNVRDILLRNDQDQLLLGAGIKFPISTVILFTEYTAEIFTHFEALSYRENSSRLTQGVSILGPWNLTLDFALDFDLSSSKEVAGTFYGKDYADWKLSIGAHYQFSLSKKSQPGREPLRASNVSSNRNELDEIKMRRQRARLEIDNMNEALEEEPEEKDEAENDEPPR